MQATEKPARSQEAQENGHVGMQGMRGMSSLQKQVEDYFRRNSDEELTIDDVAEKFGKTRGWCEEVLRDMELMGYLSATYIQQGTVRTKIYRAGYLVPEYRSK